MLAMRGRDGSGSFREAILVYDRLPGMAGFETTFQTLPSGYRQQLPGPFCHDLDRRLKVPRLVPIKKTEQAPKSTQPFFDNGCGIRQRRTKAS
jgi:hypothetical protein